MDSAIEYAAKRAPYVMKAVTAALELFPPAARDMARVPRPVNEAQARQRRRHLWKYQAGTWRCALCRDWLNSATLPRYSVRQTCKGRAIADEAAQISADGHTLCRADAELPFTICTTCGAWGNRRTRKLAHRCAHPTAAGAQAIKRAASGWHPMLRKDGRGNHLPRDRAVLTHAFDVGSGSWRPIAVGAAAAAAVTEPTATDGIATDGQEATAMASTIIADEPMVSKEAMTELFNPLAEADGHPTRG